MRIQHNIMAMNAYRNYNTNTSALSKNLEKLSSGYKINRAGDDAAGLAISEKMRAQITGLEGAQSNAKDGISLVQTAEGALTEVHDMLNRMYSLAEQSANGTYENETDRAQLQKEVKNLKDEINRIADSSNFNGIKLLDGSLSETKVDVATVSIAAGGGVISSQPAGKAESTTGAVTAGTAGAAKLTVQYTDASGKLQSVEVDYTAVADAANNAAAMQTALSGNSELSSLFDISVSVDTKLVFTAKEAGATGIQVTSVEDSGGKVAAGVTFSDGESAYTNVTATGITTALTSTALAADDSFTINGTTYEFVKDADDKPTEGATAVMVGKTDAETLNNLNKELANVGIKATVDADGSINFKPIQDGAGLSLQIGDTGEDFNQLEVSIKDCHTTAIGIEGIDIGTQAGAKAALETIKSAINYVSDVRGGLGATQNRLDHTINNLSVMQENIQDAESSIRDTDIAEEMMSYTKNNILIQSAQAMLAQANQVPQGVLQLMQ